MRYKMKSADIVIPLQKKITKSKYLVVLLKNDGQAVVYHRLFGNLHCLNEGAVDILNLFQCPASVDSLPDYASNQIPVIESFYNNYFLVESEENERKPSQGLSFMQSG